MKYEAISFYGHSDYRQFLKENQDIEIDFVNAIQEHEVTEGVLIIVTLRRVEN